MYKGLILTGVLLAAAATGGVFGHSMGMALQVHGQDRRRACTRTQSTEIS